MKINFVKAGIAGILGTVAFDLVGFLFTGTFWDIPALLGAKLFGEGVLIPGVLAHYGNGVILAVLFAGVAPSLWGNRWARVLTFMTVQTITGVWFFMLPLLGLGVMGLNAGIAIPVIGLIRHWAFGLVVAWAYPLEAEVKDRVRDPRLGVDAAVASRA
jgi:hypothetical protein